jgi:hypothetical protein
VRELIRVIGLSKYTINRSLQRLVISGRLIGLEKGKYGPKGKRKSSLYDLGLRDCPGTAEAGGLAGRV